MANFTDHAEVMAFTLAISLLLFTTNRALDVAAPSLVFEVDEEEPFGHSEGQCVEAALNVDHVTLAALHHFRLCNVFSLFDQELGFWVKPRSTTWFSKFLFGHYDDDKWIQMFRMTKVVVFSLPDLLQPHVEKQDTKYRLAIPVLIRVACTLFKLTHGASLFICSKMFVVGKNIVSLLLREVVYAINETLRHELKWPSGQTLLDTQVDFFQLCRLPGVVGAIDATHISILKPKYGALDYYYFKSGGYTINCQAVVDSSKRFLDLYLGMPSSTNDARILRRSSLYHLTLRNNLFDARFAADGFSPYLLEDSGYPLLHSLMVPHRGPGHLTIAEALYNRKLRKGRCVVENAFGILKQTFRELLGKSDISVTFLPDVITCCTILHNVFLGQSHEDVERFMEVLRTEGLEGEVIDEEAPARDIGPDIGGDDLRIGGGRAVEKRTELGIYLALQRNIVI
jgi:hypothetical protein